MPRWEDLREGMELPPLEKTPTSDTARAYFGSWRVGMPAFFDREAARRQGLPDTIVPGPLKLSFMAQMVQRWAGPGAFVRSGRAAHRRPDFAGRTMRVRGTVARVYQQDDRHLADVELWIENAEGERTSTGAVTVELREQA